MSSRFEQRKQAERSVDKRLGAPSALRIGIFTTLAALVGLAFRVIPWAWALQMILTAGIQTTTVAWVAFLCAVAHTLIAYALQLMARRYGVSDRHYWLWSLLGVFGLLIGWLVMRRSGRAKYFRERRLELIDQEVATKS